MAKDSKSTGGTAVEVVARRVRSLTDEILEAARRGGEASLEAYESFLKTVADVQEAAGARSAEWVTSMARGQAAFTREVAEASPAAARSSSGCPSQTSSMCGSERTGVSRSASSACTSVGPTPARRPRAEVHGGRLAQRDDRGAQHHAVGHEDRAPAARERGVEEAERRDRSLRRARSLACCASWRARTVSSSGAVDSGERLWAQNLIAPSR